jgi:hypothetical protein
LDTFLGRGMEWPFSKSLASAAFRCFIKSTMAVSQWLSFLVYFTASFPRIFCSMITDSLRHDRTGESMDGWVKSCLCNDSGLTKLLYNACMV